MLRNSETIKQYVVLGTDAKVPANLVHVTENIIATDGR